MKIKTAVLSTALLAAFAAPAQAAPAPCSLKSIASCTALQSAKPQISTHPLAGISARRSLPTLTKSTARRIAHRQAGSIAEALYYEIGPATDWDYGAEAAVDTKRRTRHKIDVDASVYLEFAGEGFAIQCDYVLRVWRYRDGPRSRMVTTAYTRNEIQEDDCYEVDYDDSSEEDRLDWPDEL